MLLSCCRVLTPRFRFAGTRVCTHGSVRLYWERSTVCAFAVQSPLCVSYTSERDALYCHSHHWTQTLCADTLTRRTPSTGETARPAQQTSASQVVASRPRIRPPSQLPESRRAACRCGCVLACPLTPASKACPGLRVPSWPPSSRPTAPVAPHSIRRTTHTHTCPMRACLFGQPLRTLRPVRRAKDDTGGAPSPHG